MKKVFSFFASRMFVFFALIALQAWVLISLMFAVESINTWVRTALSAASILLVLWITSKKENPAYKIGWIIVVLFLPVLGISLYFFFSQRKLGPRDRAAVFEIYKKTRHLLEPQEEAANALRQESASGARQSQYIYKSSMYPLYRHTQTKYYPMGQAFYADLIPALEQAERYIFMEYFIIQEGKLWDSVLAILEKKAAQGLDVRLIYDDIGCIHTLPGNYYERLRQKGIKCVAFNPLKPILNSMFNNRDHRKITVIDGHTAFCGGANLADEYINEVERFGRWKDAVVRLRGAGAWPLLLMFLQMWAFTAKEAVDYESYLPGREQSEGVRSDGFVQPFGDDPLDHVYTSESVFLNMITRAKRYVYINTPYLVIGSELMTALTTAAESGVDVRVTVPHIPDKKLVFLLTRAHYAQLIRAGVKIYEYTPGFLHSKTFVCDDRYGLVGTINMDFRSLYLHFECGVWMYGTSCLAEMKRDYLDTVKESREITYADTQDIRWYTRFLQTVLRVFGPLL